MAIFHLSVKTVSRSAGRSSTAAAAYRAGVEITDRQTGEIHDYRRKSGIESVELFAPSDAPKWATDRAELWNAAEVSEKRKNSTVAREFEVALPAELSADQRRELAHDFTKALVKKYGFAADCAIHLPGKNGDSQNHHAHILCSTRKLTAEGFTAKTRELDDRATGAAQVVECRELFANMTNVALERAGHSVRVDHRSLEAQGIDRDANIHLGPTATAIERRGEVSEKTRQHQERQAEAADKVAAMVAIAEAQARAQQQEIEDDGIRIQALERIGSNVAAASRAGRTTDRACKFAVEDHAGISKSLGAAIANIGRSESAFRASDQHMDAAQAAWPSTFHSVRSSANDLGKSQNNLRAAGENLGRAVQIARGRQHYRHAGAVAQALGWSLKRLVPAIAAIPRQVELHLVELANKTQELALEAQRRKALAVEQAKAEAAAKVAAEAQAQAKAQAEALTKPKGINPRSAYHPDNIAKREAKEKEMATQAERDLVAEATRRKAVNPSYRPTPAELKAVDEVLIDQARVRLGIPLPIEPAPAIPPIQPTREAVPPALSLVDQLKESFAKFVEWISGNGGECIEIDTHGSDHYGSIVQRDDLHAVQNLGRRKYAIHQLDRLDKLPALDDPKMEIKYRGGVGQVTGKLGQVVEL